MSTIQRIIATIFLVIGLAALGGGVFMAVVPAIPPEFTDTAQATITDISTYYGSGTGRSGRDVKHSVLVAYEVDGQAYERELGYYSTGMSTGQKMDIQYDTREPNRIASPAGRMTGAVIFGVLGIAFTVVGIFLQVKPVPIFAGR